jgi:hypothetical protein
MSSKRGSSLSHFVTVMSPTALHPTLRQIRRFSLAVLVTAIAVANHSISGQPHRVRATAGQLQPTWTRLDPPAKPIERWLHGASYDSARGRMLVFGGQCNCTGALGDLWIFDGASWSLQPQPPGTDGPAARLNIGQALVHNPTTSQTLLFGGFTTQRYLSDTWILDNGAWRNVSPQVSPEARDAHAIAALGSKFVMWSGSARDPATWIFDGAFWFARSDTVTPPMRVYHSMVYDRRRGVVVMHGGLPITTNGAGTVPLTDTWEFNEQIGWRKVDTPVAPPGRWAFGMAYDDKRGRAVLFGGSGPTSNRAQNDVWEYDGATWRQVLSANQAPGVRSSASLVYNTQRDELVLFGGRRIDDTTSTLTYSDTWILAEPKLSVRRFLPVALLDAPAQLREREDNDTIPTANALPLNADLTGITDDTRDVFIVRPQTTGTITITLNGLPQAADARVQLQVFQGTSTIANDTDAPYQALIPNPSGDYVVVVFTDKTNYAPNSPYVLKATQ